MHIRQRGRKGSLVRKSLWSVVMANYLCLHTFNFVWPVLQGGVFLCLFTLSVSSLPSSLFGPSLKRWVLSCLPILTFQFGFSSLRSGVLWWGWWWWLWRWLRWWFSFYNDGGGNVDGDDVDVAEGDDNDDDQGGLKCGKLGSGFHDSEGSQR